MKKGMVLLKTIAIQLCFLCLQLTLFMHSANAETQAERAKVASVLFNGKATNHEYNIWGDCPVVNGKNWCTIQKAAYIGGHSGIDIQTTTKSKKDTFYSVSTGIVITAGSGTYKTIAVYDASRNLTVIYLHASAVNVSMGDSISVGTPLGKQGDSGASGAIHVHLEAQSGRQTSSTPGGKPNTIDPVATALSYINKTTIGNSSEEESPFRCVIDNYICWSPPDSSCVNSQLLIYEGVKYYNDGTWKMTLACNKAYKDAVSEGLSESYWRSVFLGRNDNIFSTGMCRQ